MHRIKFEIKHVEQFYINKHKNYYSTYFILIFENILGYRVHYMYLLIFITSVLSSKKILFSFTLS